jgi:hypothetical protein
VGDATARGRLAAGAATHTDARTGAWRNLNADELRHRLFDDQELAEYWQTHRLSTVDGQAVRHEPVWVDKDEGDQRTCVVAVRVPDASRPTVWQIGTGRRALRCPLPALGMDAVLRFELTTIAGDRQLYVSVDGGSPGMVGRAAQVWQAYADGDVGGVLPELEPLLRAVRTGASPSAFPALVVALIGLRLGTAADLPGWLTGDPGWPDFGILATERRLRNSDGAEAGRLLAAAGFAMPFAVETFGYAITHARAQAKLAVSPPVVATAERAMAMHRPGGFFCVMSQPS